MKGVAFLIAVLLVAWVSTPTWADGTFTFADDFESGLGNWTVAPPPAAGLSGPKPMTLSDAQNAVPSGGSYSMHTVSTLEKMYHNLGQELAGEFTASWYIYDDTLWCAYGEVRAYDNNGLPLPYANYGLQQLFAAGKYTTYSSYYQGRVLFDTNNNGFGWFDLNGQGAPRRSPGWHRFDIKRVGSGAVKFYVDGILSMSMTNALPASIDCMAFGNGGWSSGSGNAWIDGVTISTPVPEPCSILALLCGIGAMGGLIWRRKSA